MHSQDKQSRRDFINCLVIESFQRVGRLKSDTTGQMRVLVEDLIKEDIELNVLTKALNYHAKNSRFVPTLCDIMEYVAQPNAQDEADFMERFRRQGLSAYAWHGLDSDVHTVRKAIGPERLVGCTKQEYTWLEKEIRIAYRQLKKGEINLIDNPIKNNIKQLPCGGHVLGKAPSMIDCIPALKGVNLSKEGGNVFS